MDTSTKFLVQIGILLLVVNIGGAIAQKLKQPAILGQITAGMVLGAFAFQRVELINHLSELGVIFLLFIAGIETDLNELKSIGKASLIVAILGVIVPMILVSGIAYLFTDNIISSLVIGLISIATSVSVSVKTLKEIGFLKSKQGICILGAAIIDDILGVFMLTVIIGMASSGQNLNMLLVLAKMIMVFSIIFIVGFILLKGFLTVSLPPVIKEKIVSYSIVLCLILAYISEELGVAAIAAAYLTGIIFSMSSYSRRISHDIQIISNIFFTPIFFGCIGMIVHFRSLSQGIIFSFVMLVLGIIGKVIGCGWGARIIGFNEKHSLQIGIGMIPRAEVALIIANLGLSMQLINLEEFSSAIVLVVATSLITPMMLKWSFNREEETQTTAILDKDYQNKYEYL